MDTGPIFIIIPLSLLLLNPLEAGLSAPRHVNGTKGGNVTIRCKYDIKAHSSSQSWCKVLHSYTDQCENTVSPVYKDLNGRVRIEKHSNYFDVIMESLQMKDSGTYRCVYGYPHYFNEWKILTADVELIITDPQIFLTTSAVATINTVTKRSAKTVTARKDMHLAKASSKASSPIKGALSQSPLLYGIICLLAIIAITLLMILLKLYCKRRKDRVQSPDLGGGTFHMSDIRNDLYLANPVPKPPYTGCTDDSSSTSSESSGHSFGNKSVSTHHQYLTIIPTCKDADYENVPEEMPSVLPDYENMTPDKDQDYVNIPESQNTSSTEDQDDEAGHPKGKWKKSTASCKSSSSSESSSSDESEEESVNYSLVVFKKGTE
ncbi:CMRF35-like molecule 6 isoform X2 [Pygocentrus nattereri]|uniref:CMRF35-like molecule 6 isoform X2 n=1 Tax=Pygocentrus nattereri TaxID=42514 RepID=UPI000814AB6E|nr:CMRF35-like molecule 6 isoform X2 [Pygocentrus nattereri]